MTLHLVRVEYKWAIKWQVVPELNETLANIYFVGNIHKDLLFDTKTEAQWVIRGKYGYIAKRKDLRGRPHYWRMPKAVRVKVTIEEYQLVRKKDDQKIH